MASRLSTAHIARWCARHPWLVVAVWLVVLALAGVAATGLDGALTAGDMGFTNRPESVRGQELLAARMGGGDARTETVVVHSETLTVDDPAFQSTVTRVAADLTGLQGLVVSAPTYYQAKAAGAPQASAMVSADRHTTLIPVTLAPEGGGATLGIGDIVAVVQRDTSPAVKVMTVGAEQHGECVQEHGGQRPAWCRVGGPAHDARCAGLGLRGGGGRGPVDPAGRRRHPSRHRSHGAGGPSDGTLVLRGQHGDDDRPRGGYRLRAVHHRAVPRGAAQRHAGARRHRDRRWNRQQGRPLLGRHGDARLGRALHRAHHDLPQPRGGSGTGRLGRCGRHADPRARPDRAAGGPHRLAPLEHPKPAVGAAQAGCWGRGPGAGRSCRGVGLPGFLGSGDQGSDGQARVERRPDRRRAARPGGALRADCSVAPRVPRVCRPAIRAPRTSSW